MTRKAVKVDGQYELLLPLKDEDIWLSNNRAATIKRLESLRSKFKKDDLLSKKYKNFIEELMEKGYAKKYDGKGQMEKLGMFHFTVC